MKGEGRCGFLFCFGVEYYRGKMAIAQPSPPGAPERQKGELYTFR